MKYYKRLNSVGDIETFELVKRLKDRDWLPKNFLQYFQEVGCVFNYEYGFMEANGLKFNLKNSWFGIEDTSLFFGYEEENFLWLILRKNDGRELQTVIYTLP